MKTGCKNKKKRGQQREMGEINGSSGEGAGEATEVGKGVVFLCGFNLKSI